MKRQFILAILFISSFQLFSQTVRSCIKGKNTVELNESFNLSLNTNLNAQCINCHDWDVTNGLQIIGSDQGSSVQIVANQIGTYNVSLTYFDESGCKSCSKIITVVENTCPEIPNLSLNVDYFGGPFSYGGNATLTLPNEIDATTISSINWRLFFGDNEGIFSQSNSVIYNSNPPEYNVNFFLGRCPVPNDQLIRIDATVNFNNGCPLQLLIFKYLFEESDYCDGDLNSNNSRVKIFPNPSNSGNINVSIKDIQRKNITVRVIDFLTGQIILNKKLKTNNIENVNTKLELPQSFSNKMVLLEIIENNAIIDTKKIIFE